MPKQGYAKFGKYEFQNEVETKDEYEWHMYYETPIMPTYIIGMAVAKDFKYSEISSKNWKDKTYRAWVEPSTRVHDPDTDEDVGWKKITEKNVNYTQQFIVFFEKYFNIKDDIPKIDSIDVIKGWAGAMENWGIVIYFNANALISINTIAHEAAHFWFGNLVTCKNWAE